MPRCVPAVLNQAKTDLLAAGHDYPAAHSQPTRRSCLFSDSPPCFYPRSIPAYHCAIALFLFPRDSPSRLPERQNTPIARCTATEAGDSTFKTPPFRSFLRVSLLEMKMARGDVSVNHLGKHPSVSASCRTPRLSSATAHLLSHRGGFRFML